jgi:hypothetical protein
MHPSLPHFLTLKVIGKGKDDEWLFLSALLFGKVDACLLFVEDKCVAVVAGPAGREGLQVLAQQVAGREIRAAYVPHHPMQIFFSLLNNKVSKNSVGDPNPRVFEILDLDPQKE